MAVPFARTLGSVRSDHGRTAFLGGGLGLLLLGGWLVWVFSGRIVVYRTSSTAHLEVIPGPTELASPTSGRITDVHLVVGTSVAAGDVLVALDASAESIALARAQAALAALEPQLESVARELEAEDEAAKSGAAVGEESERATQAKQRGLEVVLAQAREEEKRTRSMVEAGVVAAEDLSRAIAATKQARAALEAQVHEVGGQSASRQQQVAARNVRRAQLDRQRSELEAAVVSGRGDIDQLAHEIERRTVRAPIAGVLGQVAMLRPGAVLAEGAVIATIVPPGTLQVVADYGPATIGQIAPGQHARVLLDGFPWTRYGTLPARVARVGNELRNGVIRVELTLLPGPPISVAHGMTGTVEIEVETASPVELLVRAIGAGTSP